MASSTSSVRGIGEELSAHIASLEKALSAITATKRHLANNAAQAKSRIHSMMSRQLEALRTREVWLLDQVELLHDTKDSLLLQQADSLRQALGALTSCRQYLESGEPADIESTIQDTIQKLNDLELTPLENRHLSFKADLTSMRDAIHSFGKVESQMPGLDMGWTGDSRSLPRAFEEYEDEEEDAMYCKTVQDVMASPGGCTHRRINMSVPKLKAHPSDWLFLPSDVQPPPKQSTATLPLFKSDLSEWLLRDPSTAKASVEHWLQEIQTHTEDDEEDTLIGSMQHVVPGSRTHKISTTTTGSSIEVISLPGSTATSTTMSIPVTGKLTTGLMTSSSSSRQPVSSYFAQVAAAPSDQWLKREGKLYRQPDHVAMSYFAEVARRGNQHWLLENEKDSSCCKASNTNCCPPVRPDIEDLDIMTCTQPSPEPMEEDEKDVDEREVAVRNNIYQLCRANEVCHTFTDCVCDNNCAGDGATKSSMKAWLARPASNEDLRTGPAFEHFNLVGGAKASEWLAAGKSVDKSPEVDSSLYPPFLADSSNSAWLLPQRITVSQNEAGCPFTRLRNRQSSEWLPSVNKSYRSENSNDQWLASPARSSLPETRINPWLASDTSVPARDVTVDRLKAYLEEAQPKYQWSLTESELDAKHDKPIPKKQELPECDFKDSNRDAESAKWLLISKDEREDLKTREVAMEQDMPELFPIFGQNKEALGEWLMNIHSDF